MKKFVYFFVLVFIMSNAAFADFSESAFPQKNQGFQDYSTYSVSQIKDILNMSDDAIAVIRGNIVKRLSDDKYLFKDKSGQIVVEIDYKYWGGLQVNEKDILELTGKIDRDYNSIVFDVFMVKKTK